ncbi:hypothetical protein [Saccharomonospora iraqiensis]|nr:hypothetical protein [Saccharomonospora iraqiensis]
MKDREPAGAHGARRPADPAPLGTLPDLDVDTATIVDDLEAERAAL